jgi:hypothetical protein
MKKVVLFAVMALCVSISSCSDDESLEDITKSKLIGTWNLEEVYYYNVQEYISNGVPKKDSTKITINNKEIGNSPQILNFKDTVLSLKFDQGSIFGLSNWDTKYRIIDGKQINFDFFPEICITETNIDDTLFYEIDKNHLLLYGRKEVKYNYFSVANIYRRYIKK